MTVQIRKTGVYILRIHNKVPAKIRLLEGTEVDILQTTRSVCLCSLVYADNVALTMIENDNLVRREQQLIVRSTDSSVSLNEALANNDAAWQSILSNYQNGCFNGKIGNLAWETQSVSATKRDQPAISENKK